MLVIPAASITRHLTLSETLDAGAIIAANLANSANCGLFADDSMKNPDLSQLCLVRRPICDHEQTVFAYEMVFGSTESGPSREEFSDETSSELLVSSLVDIGLAELAGNKPVFLPLSSNYIAGNLPLPESWPQLGFEIRDGILPDPVLKSALENLSSKKKYIICLSQVKDIENRRDIIELADYVKLNVSTLSFAELQAQVKALSTFNVKLIASGISMPEMYDSCKKMDIHGFIGYYFCMPRKSLHQAIPAARMTVLNIISELENPDNAIDKLVEIIEKDVSFSYRILRFMNSAYYHLQKTVDTMNRAVTLAGIKNIKTWAIILAHSRLDDKPHELMITSLIRAKMCETLAKPLGLQPDAGFILGLFSTLDALLDNSMETILQHLPLADGIKTALLNKEPSADASNAISLPGNAQDQLLLFLIQTVINYEKADWQTLRQDQLNLNHAALTDAPISDISNGKLKQTYIDSVAWAEDISAGLLTTQTPSNVVRLRR